MKKKNVQLQSKLAYISKSLSRGTNKKYETMVINAIYSKLNNPNLEIKTQQHVTTNSGKPRYIDLYFPQLRIAVEVNEGYHDNKYQRLKDKEREQSIKLSYLESTIIDKVKEIQFVPINIVENGHYKTYEEVITRIDEVVELINNEIKKMPNPLIWHFSKDERINSYIKKGYLTQGDYFDSMIDILKIFGKEVKFWRRCGYKNIWSPTLSVKGSNKNGWINTISDDLSEIYERGTNKKEKTYSDFINDKNNQARRYTFMKYKDALGCRYRRFIGVYMADRFDNELKAEVWKLVDKEVEIKKL